MEKSDPYAHYIPFAELKTLSEDVKEVKAMCGKQVAPRFASSLPLCPACKTADENA